MRVEGKRGQLNLLDKGMIVQVKKKCVVWYCANMASNFYIPISYESDPTLYNEMSFWLTAHVKKKWPIGKVVGFGSFSDQNILLNYVRVEFKHNKRKLRIIIAEDDLKRVTK